MRKVRDRDGEVDPMDGNIVITMRNLRNRCACESPWILPSSEIIILCKYFSFFVFTSKCPPLNLLNTENIFLLLKFS